MINVEHEYIHIHIPKCAGSSVEQTLIGSQFVEWDHDNKLWVQHATALQIKQLYCDQYDDYFTFAFVRNPWARALSDYCWFQKLFDIEGTFRDFLLLENEFDLRMLRLPHLDETGRGDHLLPQKDFVVDSSDNIMVDFIGKVENMQHDFDVVCDKIGIPRIEIEHTNTTDHEHYTEYYDDETREIVTEKYAQDIELFGYEFEK